ncbi:hypothetical protein PRIPAC_86832 [Pristionchus pacificus]|uniref:Lipoprotein n=1 Tax=Pristionchus pacificus TaxID=54126 RepID=A0A8R1UPB1_PRIPA|nr:hypothetical protein PRIPAC_86832 [Pristionchus pacificus]|eukprot:PDM68641.1 hypothetical protein PRIPAC_46943 [Pristionchus pacificus]
MQRMLLLILFTILPAAVIGCVPVKTPEKGISAGCQKYESAVVECNRIRIAEGVPPPGPFVYPMPLNKKECYKRVSNLGPSKNPTWAQARIQLRPKPGRNLGICLGPSWGRTPEMSNCVRCVANTALTSMSILCPAGKIPDLYSPISKATCDATTKQWTFFDKQGAPHSQSKTEMLLDLPLTAACMDPI